jgi:AcrR family transcriptional regulator
MNTFSEKQKQLKEQAAQEAIYEATLKVIAQQQGDQLKVQDIAAAAGLATGTLYNYFNNKVELLTFVDQRLHTLILNKIEEVTDSALTPAEKLKSVIREMFAFFKAYHIVFDLTEKFGTKTQIPQVKKHEGLNQARRCLARILSEGIAQQQFRNVEPAAAAKHFFSAIIGVIEIQSWLQDYEMSGEARELAKYFLSYLTIEPL